MFPLEDIWRLLERAYNEGSRRTITLAVTFSTRISLAAGYTNDVRAAASKQLGIRKLQKSWIGCAIVEKHIIPFCGWGIIQASSVHKYRRDEKKNRVAQQMINQCWKLQRLDRRNDSIDWLMVDGHYVGFPASVTNERPPNSVRNIRLA